jgi:predicted RNA-binding protein YlxR (DUF448 family)
MSVKDITGYTLRTLFHSQIQEVTRDTFRSTIQLTRCFWVFAAAKTVLV